MTQTLDIFLDVNVLIDGAIPWGNQYLSQPVVLPVPDGNISGTPSEAILTAVENGEQVNGQRLVLHISDHALALTTAKLEDSYKWSVEATDRYREWLLDLVESSEGSFVAANDIPTVPTIVTDQEDNHRYGEAQHCGCLIFVTNDTELVQANDISRRPLIMRPDAFVGRLQSGSP